jgi:predicted dehydrogenase
MTKRREFIKKSALGTAGIAIGGARFNTKSYASIIGANERINISVIGVGGRGSAHLNAYSQIKESHNVRIANICDVDEKFWAQAVKTVQEKSGFAPATEWDMRKVFANKDIHAVSFATPNYWHALGTIWACQAGKHVYVEKPVSHTVVEGRKMIEAGIKYKVHIQHGSGVAAGEAMDFMRNGGIGDIYMARGLCLKPRESFGTTKDSNPPVTLHYDMWLGPAPWRQYNEKMGHYNWHWFWETGNGDTGNQGPHQLHAARVGLGKEEHPVWICSFGGIYGIDPDECAQETPNTQTSMFKYADGKMLVFDTRGRYTNAEGSNNTTIGNLFYGSDGYVEYSGGWKAFRKWEKQPFAGAALKEKTEQQDPRDLRGGIGGAFGNFIDVIRSGRDQDLVNHIVGGHYSASLAHLANISYRLGGRELHFDGAKERFINDPEADALLTRKSGYRKPYVLPDKV